MRDKKTARRAWVDRGKGGETRPEASDKDGPMRRDGRCGGVRDDGGGSSSDVVAGGGGSVAATVGPSADGGGWRRPRRREIALRTFRWREDPPAVGGLQRAPAWRQRRGGSSTSSL